MTMREFHGPAVSDGTDTGTDSEADAQERPAGDSRRSGREGVQEAETRTSLPLAYHQLVENEYAACDPEDATPRGDQGRHSSAAAGTEGDRAFRAPEGHAV